MVRLAHLTFPLLCLSFESEGLLRRGMFLSTMASLWTPMSQGHQASPIQTKSTIVWLPCPKHTTSHCWEIIDTAQANTVQVSACNINNTTVTSARRSMHLTMLTTNNLIDFHSTSYFLSSPIHQTQLQVEASFKQQRVGHLQARVRIQQQRHSLWLQLTPSAEGFIP